MSDWDPDHDEREWAAARDERERTEGVTTARGCLYGLGCLIGAALLFLAVVGATVLLWGTGSAFHTAP